MDKKILVVIAVLTICLVGYGGYYAYATTILLPEDVKFLKDDLNNFTKVNESSIFNNSDNVELASEEQLNMIEKYDALSLIPQNERDKAADNLTNATNQMKSNSTEKKANITRANEIANRYDTLFMGDIANEIRFVYNEKQVEIYDKVIANMEKQAEDMRKGDTKAYVTDVREFNKIIKDNTPYMLDVWAHAKVLLSKLNS